METCSTVTHFTKVNKKYTGPVKDTFGTVHHLKDGKHHREDGPAMIFANGDEEWFINGLLHREGGPAVNYKREQTYYKNGQMHREDGPAFFKKREDGLEEYMWVVEGKIHNLNGPAIKTKNQEVYMLENTQYDDKEEFTLASREYKLRKIIEEDDA